MKELNRKIVRGAAWMVLFKFTERLLGLISTVILARLLAPADFGLVAMAMSIIAVLDILGTFSFDLALIQNRESEKRHYDTAWTFTVLYGVLSALALVILANPTANFYNDVRLEEIIYVLAFGTLIQGFENIGVVAFQKDLNLRSEFIFRVAKKIVGFALTITLAIIYKNYWALVIGAVMSRAAGIPLSYLLHPFRPRFSMAGKNDLFHFSKWMFINNIVLFINNRGVDFVLGKIAGAPALGVYSVAYEISNLPTTELVWPIGKALFPGYVKMAHDLTLIRKGFLDALGIIVLFVLPAGLGIAVVAEPLVLVFLGKKWTEAIPLIQILAIAGTIRACFTNIGSVFLALGQPKLIAKLAVLNIFILMFLLLWAVPLWGARGAALSILIACAIQIQFYFAILMGKIELKLVSILSVIWRPVVASLIMFLAIDAAAGKLLLPLGSIWFLVIAVPAGFFIYTLSILFLWGMCGAPAGSESATITVVSSRIKSANLQIINLFR